TTTVSSGPHWTVPRSAGPTRSAPTRSPSPPTASACGRPAPADRPRRRRRGRHCRQPARRPPGPGPCCPRRPAPPPRCGAAGSRRASATAPPAARPGRRPRPGRPRRSRCGFLPARPPACPARRKPPPRPRPHHPACPTPIVTGSTGDEFAATAVTGQDGDVEFSFVSGDPALDLAATVGYRRTEPVDLLKGPADLERWVSACDGLPAEVAADLASFDTAITLREAVYRLALARTRGDPFDPADVEVLNVTANGPAL